MKALIEFFSAWCTTVVWVGFIVVKAWGVTFAAWSWWWVLMPMVPWLWLALVKNGGM